MTTEDFIVYGRFLDEKVLPVGSFVKPIEDRYLPNHIKESSNFRWKADNEIFIYCSLGIILVPKRILRIV